MPQDATDRDEASRVAASVYGGMSYEQAYREALRLIGRDGWFSAWDRLGELRSIMVRHINSGTAPLDEVRSSAATSTSPTSSSGGPFILIDHSDGGPSTAA